MNTKSQASISSLPDDVLALILSKTGKKARLRDVPLVCLAWRRIAEQLTTWETIDLRSISYSADFEEGHLLCLMDHLVLFPELQSLRIDCKDTAEELFVDWTGLTNLHKLENLRIYIWGPGSGEVLPPEIYTLSALTQLAFCLAWVEGKPALKVSQLRSLRSLRIEEDEDLHPDASLGVPEQLLLLAAVQALVLKYVGGDLCIGQLTSLTSLHLNQCPLWRFPTSVSLLTQLEVLHIDIIWPDKLRARPLLTLNSLQTLTVRCYDDSKVSRNIGDLQQLTSLRRVVFEDVGELEAVSQERLAALQARFVQQGRGGVIKLVIKRKSR
ncbi:hypothetical protein WJX72_011912 [[Myrmecia] bisecta]|uniref:F-box domain-containing protein n=1 Tax=[Myrmecia] bisecta TaxID=41462 RepID=A0AAW1RA51_9CHLO